MTSQSNRMRRPNQPAPVRNRYLSATVLPLTLATAAGLGLMGCGGEEATEVVNTAPPPPPPPPPPPAITPISELMAQYNIDPRIQLGEQYAPPTDVSRVAVLQFFDVMVRGDNIGMSTWLGERDQNELSELVADGSFQNAVSEVGLIELRTGMTPGGDEAVIAILQTSSDFQPQLWRFEADDYGAEFTSGPTPINVLDKLSGDDWIARWYMLLDEEIEIAMRLDEDLQMPQKDLSNATNATVSSDGGGPGIPGRPAVAPDRPTVEPPSFDPTRPGG